MNSEDPLSWVGGWGVNIVFIGALVPVEITQIRRGRPGDKAKLTPHFLNLAWVGHQIE